MAKSLAEYLSEVRRAIPIGERQEAAQATAPINDAFDLSTYRPLSSEERYLIATMLDQSGPRECAFLPQLENLKVRSSCTCGCPTIEFAPPPDATRVDLYPQKIVADMTGEAMDGLVGLILWQAGGKLTGLEAYDLAGREPPAQYRLPRPDSVTSLSGT